MKDLEKRLAWLKEFKAWTEAGELDKMIQETEQMIEDLKIEDLKRALDGQA